MLSDEQAPTSAHASATEMIRLATGYQLSQAIFVAAKLGVADLLAGGPRNSAELASETGTHESSLYRLLRTLAAAEVLAEPAPRLFALTPLGTRLRRDGEQSVHGYVVGFGEEFCWRPWGNLLQSVQTGGNAFERTFGMPAFDYFAEHADAGAVFDEAMASRSGLIAPALAAGYDFSGIRLIVDVGGGRGAVVAAILSAYPDLGGVLVDLPHALEGAAAVLEAAGVSARCEAVSGSFFEPLPRGGDAYLLSRVVHDWDDDNAVAVLSRCREAIEPDGRVLLVERVIGSHRELPLSAFLGDLHMLVMFGGRERTADEFGALLAAAGFELTQVTPFLPPYAVIEGRCGLP